MTTNYSWALAVLQDGGFPPTQNNENNIARWMAAEEPPNTWFHNDDPLNANNIAEGDIESFPNLTVAAEATAKVILQSNMAPIANALRANASLAIFSAGCASAAWSTGGYHGRPGYIASVPQPPVVNAPGTPPVPLPPPPKPLPTHRPASLPDRHVV